MKYVTWTRALIGIGIVGLCLGAKPAVNALHPILFPEHFVDITVAFDANGCHLHGEYPLTIKTNNRSNRTIIKTEVWVEARQSGHSDNLMPHHNPHTSDYIIPPGKSDGLCWRLPIEGADASWSYTIAKKEITFQ